MPKCSQNARPAPIRTPLSRTHSMSTLHPLRSHGTRSRNTKMHSECCPNTAQMRPNAAKILSRRSLGSLPSDAHNAHPPVQLTSANPARFGPVPTDLASSDLDLDPVTQNSAKSPPNTHEMRPGCTSRGQPDSSPPNPQSMPPSPDPSSPDLTRSPSISRGLVDPIDPIDRLQRGPMWPELSRSVPIWPGLAWSCLAPPDPNAKSQPESAAQ